MGKTSLVLIRFKCIHVTVIFHFDGINVFFISFCTQRPFEDTSERQRNLICNSNINNTNNSGNNNNADDSDDDDDDDDYNDDDDKEKKSNNNNTRYKMRPA